MLDKHANPLTSLLGTGRGSLRFQRRIRLGRFLTLNFSRGGVSCSLGRKGCRISAGRHGIFLSLGVPGTGLSYRWGLSWNKLTHWSRESQREGGENYYGYPR
ncbi:MAG: DUF4236 domain-containing protein [Chloroflexi bacterium]|nr:DUF4236 domain-containing protein [Chloroflexota bacterium]